MVRKWRVVAWNPPANRERRERRAWSASISGSSQRQRLAAAPVIGGGQLFVMDTDGMVHAYDAATGAPRWTASFRVSGDGADHAHLGGDSRRASAIIDAKLRHRAFDMTMYGLILPPWK